MQRREGKGRRVRVPALAVEAKVKLSFFQTMVRPTDEAAFVFFVLDEKEEKNPRFLFFREFTETGEFHDLQKL